VDLEGSIYRPQVGLPLVNHAAILRIMNILKRQVRESWTGAARASGGPAPCCSPPKGPRCWLWTAQRKSKPRRAAIRSAGGRAIALVRDSSVEDDVAGAVAAALKEFGGLDVCYANAGISGGPSCPSSRETTERWMEVLKINLIGTFLRWPSMPRWRWSSKSAVRSSARQSVAGLRSGAGGVPYSASKAGVLSMVQTVANQLTGTAFASTPSARPD